MRIKIFPAIFLSSMLFLSFPVLAHAHFHRPDMPFQDQFSRVTHSQSSSSSQSFFQHIYQFFFQFVPQFPRQTVHYQTSQVSSRCYENYGFRCYKSSFRSSFREQYSVRYSQPVYQPAPPQEIQIHQVQSLPVQQFQYRQSEFRKFHRVHLQKTFIQQYQPAQFEYHRVNYSEHISPTLRSKFYSTSNPYCVIRYIDGLRREICD